MLARVVVGLLVLLGLALAVNVLPFGRGTPPVSAEPRLPHVFYGRVEDANGDPIPANTTIEARINNIHYAQSVNSSTGEATLDTRTHAVDGNDQNYGTLVSFQVCADDPSTEPIEGGDDDEVISFYVNGVLAATSPAGPILFEVGAVQELGITIPSLNAGKAPAATSASGACTTESGEIDEDSTPTPVPTSTPTNGGSPPGSGGGGFGGGGGGPVAPRPTPEPTPTEEERIEELAEDIDRLNAEDAADELDSLNLNDATDILKGLQPERAGEILENIRSSKVAVLLDGLESAQAAAILEKLTGEKAATVIGELDQNKAASIFNSLDAGRAAEIVNNLSLSAAATVIENINSSKAVDIAIGLSSKKASDVLGRVSPRKAGEIFEVLPVQSLEGIIEEMSEDRLIDRLPEMSVEKLMGISAEVLFRKLPNVPVEQIAFEDPPEVELDNLTVVQVSPELAIYTLPETGELVWIKLVGTPVYIEQVLGKFYSNLEDVKIEVEELSGIPSGIPALGGGQVADKVFRIGLTNATSNDLAAVRMAFYVENSWIEQNQVHKWAIQVNRFDESLNMWVPFYAKRVGEDENGIFYSVIIPGFSLFAIAGGSEVPVPVFQVADLSVSPSLALSGEEVTISARVRNSSNQTAVYPANLWINDAIEQAKAITVGAGETATVTFNVKKQQGDYRVRVDRNFGEFSVSAQQIPAASPTTSPVVSAPSPSATPVPETPEPTEVPSIPTATSVPPSAVATAVPPTSTPEVAEPTSTPQVEVEEATPMPTATAIFPTEPEEEGGLGIAAIMGIIVGIIVVLGAATAYLVVQRRRV